MPLLAQRKPLPPEINMHSVKNRFLMRIKNMTSDLYRRNWLPITARDMTVVGACLLHEWGSLKAFWLVTQNWRRLMEKRRWIMERQRATDEYIASWFRYEPTAKPAGKAVRAVVRS